MTTIGELVSEIYDRHCSSDCDENWQRANMLLLWISGNSPHARRKNMEIILEVTPMAKALRELRRQLN